MIAKANRSHSGPFVISTPLIAVGVDKMAKVEIRNESQLNQTEQNLLRRLLATYNIYNDMDFSLVAKVARTADNLNARVIVCTSDSTRVIRSPRSKAKAFV